MTPHFRVRVANNKRAGETSPSFLGGIMDILYYIGDGSHHNNRELMYSLRSIEKHCKDIGDLWIVGSKPYFLNNNIKYLWVADEFGKWWKNAFRKTKAAIEAGISDDFLLMNDDFFMMQDFDPKTYPYYHRGEIREDTSRGYTQVITSTKHVLEKLGKTTFHYGVHCPIRINGAKYLQIEKYFTQPVSARCLYGNLFCEGEQVKDCKAFHLVESVTGCYSSKNWIDEDLFKELRQLFPMPSRWEKEEA